MENLSEEKMKGRLVVFLLGQTGMSLSTLESLKYKSVILGREIGIHVKAYQPDIIVFEASVQIEDLLSDSVLDLKRDLVAEGQKILNQYNCNMDFCEEYSVYCVSEYKGDPEVFVTTFGDKIVSHLKNERLPLDNG